jgi:radical SAM superfamily enzyme YgiQ (UPF0313 family)
MGLLFVGNALRKAGYDVRVFHVTREQALGHVPEIVAWHPFLIGFSVITGDPCDVVAVMTRDLRRALPGARVVYGGVHPTIEPEQCLACEGVDYVILHEGERSAVKLANALRDGQPVLDIAGLVYWRDGGMVTQPFKAFEHNLDALDMDWSLVDIERYVAPEYGGNRRVLMGYVASRGCPHQCGFCYNMVFNARRWRHPSAAKVIRDVRALAERHNLGGVVFHDDNFTANQGWALEVISGLKVAALHVETRIDYVTEKFMQALADRNVQSIFFGIEFGSERMLKLIAKGFTVDRTRQSLSIVSKYPMSVKLSLIVGGPTETVTEYQATLRLIVWCIENMPRVGFTVGFYLPFPGTPLFDLCVQRGFQKPQRFEDWVVMDRWGNQETPIPWTDGTFLTATETARIRRWTGTLLTLYRDRSLGGRLRYVLLRWRFLHSGTRLVRAWLAWRRWGRQLADRWRWRLSRQGWKAAWGRLAWR